MKQNWFYRPSSIKKLWIGMWVILALTIVAELFIKLHPHFRLEAVFAFHAWYGFLVCAALVVFAKLLGYLVKRRDDYYDM